MYETYPGKNYDKGNICLFLFDTSLNKKFHYSYACPADLMRPRIREAADENVGNRLAFTVDGNS